MKTIIPVPDKSCMRQGLLLSRADFWPEIPKVPFKVRCVTSPDEFFDFKKQLFNSDWFSLDTETTNINPRQAKLVGMSFCWKQDEAWYIPTQCPQDETCCRCSWVLGELKQILESTAWKKLGQNLKYDKIILKNYGVDITGIVFDTLIASYLLDAGSRRHNLDLLAQKHLGYSTIRISTLLGKGKHQLGMADVPLEIVAPYAAEDAWVVTQLAPILWKEVERQQLTKLLEHVEIPLIDVLADMEYNGILVDQEKAKALQRDFESRISTIGDRICCVTNDNFNPSSPTQLREELFGRLGLQSTKQTSGGEPSTDKTVLEELAKEYALPKSIKEYRELTKLNGTYISSLPDKIFSATGRIHASFNQAVTATGRLSSSDPNLQNIPSRTKDGKEIRKIFVAPPDHVLVAVDYSQIELRVLAHYTNDPVLIHAFKTDQDVHTLVASQMKKVAPEEITEDILKACKQLNFGILYGQGPKRLAQSLDISVAEAKHFIAAYFKEFPTIKKFRASVVAYCRHHGYVKTILGRHRYIPGISEPDGPDRWTAEREAFNTVIQGSAADVLKIAMLEVAGQITNKTLAARMLLQIHDELVFEIPESSADSTCAAIKILMENAVPISVPIVVDVEIGKSWGGMRIWEPIDRISR